MIHKKHKIVIILLICILLLNFIAEPKQKSEAVGLTFGAIYGTYKGTQILGFLLACLAAGVTFNALEEAEAMFDKWQMDNNNWEPPSDGGNGWKDSVQALLAGAVGANSIGNLISSLKDWFQSIGAKEGENILNNINENRGYINGYTYEIIYKQEVINSKLSLVADISINSGPYNRLNWFQNLGATVIIRNIEPAPYGKVKVYYTWLSNNTTGESTAIVQFGNIVLPENPYPIQNIPYNVTNNSYVITDTPPTSIPQPDISVVPGIEEQITPTGEKQNVYPGTMDDLVTDLVNNTTWEDIFQTSQSTTTIPYTLTETQTGIKVDYGEEISTPFPEVDSSPIEDVSEFQGKNIGLLQSIINWLKLIYELPKLLFQIPEELSIDTSNLRLKDFQKKFPFSIPWDLYKAITVFAKSPSTPDLIIDIDTENLDVNHTIDLSLIDVPLRFARYAMSIFFIIFLAGKTRDLIKW